MRTKSGVIAIAVPAARGSDCMSLLLSKGLARFAAELTPEEANEFARQILTAANGRRMIVLADAPAVLEAAASAIGA